MSGMDALPQPLAAFEAPDSLLRVLRGLRSGGFDAWVVGGAVRDLLLGHMPHEFDLATDARPEAVAAIFARVVATGIAHGTVTVVEDGAPFEVTTYRGGAGWAEGAAPSFVGTIEEDLAKRDLTINAMAFDPLGGRFLDPTGGRRDLEAHVIRSVGDPDDRFSDDPLRIMRVCRFAARFGFRIERRSRRAIPSHLPAFEGVAVERVQSELSKILVSDHPRYGVELLRRTGILALVIPELLEGLGMRQNRWHRYDVYHHVLHALNAAAPPLAVRLATLLHDIDKPTTAAPSPKGPGEHSFYNHEVSGASRAKAICERLRFPNKLCAQVALLVREHQFVYTDGWSDGAVRRMLARVGEENFDALVAVREADIRGRGVAVEEGLENIQALEARVRLLLASRPPLSPGDLAVGGRDVMEALGIPPSALVGEALGHLLAIVIEDPDLNQRDELLRRLHAWWLMRSRG